MENKIIVLAVIVFVLTFGGSLSISFAQDNSPTNPASVGTAVRSMVELGSVNANIYDITITTLELVRGKEAMDRLKAASSTNPAPASGFEYLLARVKFEIKGRSISDKLSFDIGNEPLQWVALGSNLTEYTKPTVTAPNPELIGKVKAGQSLEGWVAFAVESKDAKPIMVFDPDSGGATGRGKTLFFKLYQ
jgi:hypothetical protein